MVRKENAGLHEVIEVLILRAFYIQFYGLFAAGSEIEVMGQVKLHIQLYTVGAASSVSTVIKPKSNGVT